MERGAEVPLTKGRQLTTPDELAAFKKITVANTLVEDKAFTDEFALISGILSVEKIVDGDEVGCSVGWPVGCCIFF